MWLHKNCVQGLNSLLEKNNIISPDTPYADLENCWKNIIPLLVLQFDAKINGTLVSLFLMLNESMQSQNYCNETLASGKIMLIIR